MVGFVIFLFGSDCIGGVMVSMLASTVRKHRFSRLLIPYLCRMFQNDMQRSTIESHAFHISLQFIVAYYYSQLVNILHTKHKVTSI
jgi:hypothetical protein